MIDKCSPAQEQCPPAQKIPNGLLYILQSAYLPVAALSSNVALSERFYKTFIFPASGAIVYVRAAMWCSWLECHGLFTVGSLDS